MSMVYTFADASPRRKTYAVLRQQRQPRHLPRRLVCLHLRTADALAHGQPGAGYLGFEQGRLGALPPQADFSQADDLAAKDPKRLEELKALF